MSEIDSAEVNGREIKRSRKPLLVMLAVAILPVFGAYFAFFTGIGVPKNTVNAGVFLEPVESIEGLVGEEIWEEIQTDKKWRLLIPIAKDCSDSCNQNIYTTRQVHVRLDQKSERLQRLAVQLDPTIDLRVLKTLNEDNPRLKIINNDTELAKTWFKKVQTSLSLEKDFYLLVDQEGRAMMAYTNAQHGNDLLKDIKRALKSSIDYQ